MNAVAIAPDGTWLASGGGDGAVRIWAATGRGIRCGRRRWRAVRCLASLIDPGTRPGLPARGVAPDPDRRWRLPRADWALTPSSCTRRPGRWSRDTSCAMRKAARPWPLGHMRRRRYPPRLITAAPRPTPPAERGRPRRWQTREEPPYGRRCGTSARSAVDTSTRNWPLSVRRLQRGNRRHTVNDAAGPPAPPSRSVGHQMGLKPYSIGPTAHGSAEQRHRGGSHDANTDGVPRGR